MSCDPDPSSSRTTFSIFTADEQSENEARRQKLIETVTAGHTVSLIGAGCSVPAGYPTWGRLLNLLENLASQTSQPFSVDATKRSQDALGYVDDIKNHLQRCDGHLNRYHAFMATTFAPNHLRYANIHRLILETPFKGILTTNYDPTIELAMLDVGHISIPDVSLVIGSSPDSHISEWFLNFDSELFPRRIAHIHGHYTMRNSIILGLSDFEDAYALRPGGLVGSSGSPHDKWTLHRRFLWSILATRRVVFLGFSMTDPYFMQMLKIVNDDLWRWGSDTHFAIMSISQRDAPASKVFAQRLSNDYGVCVVFYDNTDGSHRGLDQLLEELAEASRARGTARSARTVPSTVQGSSVVSQSSVVTTPAATTPPPSPAVADLNRQIRERLRGHADRA